MKRAYFKVSKQLLEKLFMLPPGVQIRTVQESVDYCDNVSIAVEGDALPESCEWRAGQMMKQVSPNYSQKYTTHTEFDGWGI